MMSERGFMFLSMSRVTSIGVRSPWTATAQRKRSANASGLFDMRTGRDHGRNVVADVILKTSHGVDVAIEDHDVGADALGVARGRSAQGSRAEDHHGCRWDPRRTADQQPLAAELVEQKARAHDHREPPGDFGHGFEHRRVAVVFFDDLVPHRGDVVFQEGGKGLRRRQRQVPARDHDLILLEPAVVRRLRRRHADHELRSRSSTSSSE